MKEYSDAELIKLNKMGFIPGPGELLDSFCARVDYCLNLKDHLPNELKCALSTESSSPEILASPIKYLQSMYDIAPDWIPLFFSNYKLSFWHGGCAWIFQMTEEEPTTALIQLRSSLLYSPKYLGLYRREELLTHELCHVGRMMFQEPRYEEFFAYQTSCFRIRKWLGPILQSSVESVCFLLVLFLIVVFDLFLVALHHHDAYMMALWIKTLPVVFIGLGLWRLWKRHRAISATLKNLREVLGTNEKASFVAYRLTDSEIESFSQMSGAQIIEYMNDQQELRWQVIRKAYFS